MGAADGPHPEDGEGPARRVTVPGFSIRRHAVTNADYAVFTKATGYRTVAEETGGALVFAQHLQAPSEQDADCVGSGLLQDSKTPDASVPWWVFVPGASWRAPHGAGSTAMPDLPVVQIARSDAAAFCAWAGSRLPTEAEWERAAQSPPPEAQRNIWRGVFPDKPDEPFGPVNASEGHPNAAGLLHTSGNVWEWCADRFTRLHSPRPQVNPRGPLNGSRFVVKGGSYLCHASYCARFRPSSRRGEYPDTATCHLGFRDVKSDDASLG